MGGRADVHAGVMQDEVLEGDELAGEPEAGAGVLEMRPADKTLGDRARPDALVEAGERVFGGGERIFQRIQDAAVGDFISKARRGSREQRGDVDRDGRDESRREHPAGSAAPEGIGALLRLAVDFDGGAAMSMIQTSGRRTWRKAPAWRRDHRQRAVGDFDQKQDVGGAG